MQSIKWVTAAATALLFSLANSGACLASAQAGEAAPAAKGAAKAQPDIVMYATQSCGYCKKARQFFTARNVTWREIDIDSSDAAQNEWKARGGMGTPLIFIGSTRIEGYMESKMDEALAQYTCSAKVSADC